MKLKELVTKAENRFDELNDRERKLVTYGGTLAAAMLTWFLLIEPAWLTVQSAPAQRAALEDKAAQVMRAAQDLEALRGARSRVLVPESDLQARLQTMLQEQGIEEHATLTRTEEGDFRVEFTNVPATGFLAWIAKVESISSLRLNLAEMEKTEAAVLMGYVTLLPVQQGNAGQSQ